VVEVDGSTHATDAAIAHDVRRDAFLGTHGYRVVRVSAGDVLNRLDAVAETILSNLGN
jgi:very-short-patch-repair endonuclease